MTESASYAKKRSHTNVQQYSATSTTRDFAKCSGRGSGVSLGNQFNAGVLTNTYSVLGSLSGADDTLRTVDTAGTPPVLLVTHVVNSSGTSI